MERLPLISSGSPANGEPVKKTLSSSLSATCDEPPPVLIFTLPPTSNPARVSVSSPDFIEATRFRRRFKGNARRIACVDHEGEEARVVEGRLPNALGLPIGEGHLFRRIEQREFATRIGEFEACHVRQHESRLELFNAQLLSAGRPFAAFRLSTTPVNRTGYPSMTHFKHSNLPGSRNRAVPAAATDRIPSSV